MRAAGQPTLPDQAQRPLTGNRQRGGKHPQTRMTFQTPVPATVPAAQTPYIRNHGQNS